MLQRYRWALVASAALALAIGPAYAQKISQFTNLSGNSAPLTDAFVAQSNSCAGGNCRETVGQILGALGAGSIVQSPSPTDYVVLTPNGQAPRLAPLSSLTAINSAVPSLANPVGSLTDSVVTQSTSCAGDSCRETLGQILGALGAGQVQSSPSASAYVVLAPNGATPQLAPISAIAALVPTPTAQPSPISTLPNLAGNEASLSDAFQAESSSCTGGNCRETLGQLLGTLASGTVVTTPSPSDYVVLAPSGQTLRLAPVSALQGSGSGGTTGALLSKNNLSDLASVATARSNLGLGSLALQGSNQVSITGGAITGLTSLSGTGIVRFSNPASAPSTLDTSELEADLNTNGAGFNAASMFSAIIGCSTCFNNDAMRGVATEFSGATASNTTGVAGYVINQNNSTEYNSVSLFGVGISAVSGAQVWGVNTNLTDNVVQGASTGTGQTLNNEFDFNVTSPNTQINGLLLQGNSLAEPASANGVTVLNLHIGHYDKPWSNAFYSGNGASQTAVYVGTEGTPAAANVSSQPIAFITTNSASAEEVTELYATPSALITSAHAFMITPATVSTLPACSAGTGGSIGSVTDATSASYGAPVSGGGSIHIPVFCNGTNWTIF